MMNIDWGALTLGLGIGAGVSTLFFAGLAFGMRFALGAARPAAILLFSASLRIALLLGVGVLVAQMGAWAFCSYALSFLLVRFVAITFARPAKGGV
ncbi:ATP synthase subunit I [Lentibacter sp. XHP0401]|uniref:N-ATPase subunit AtpR n=1 Tax=Lentibacter sp. XHP0401 TaxID=2984334 RepID=UPI0021E73839|nr:ATP synthase subunit I [Lentibacter sp. XHP0401]MCV2892095.1 ATP synthase subunit AtpR [Lentibacter sp. XHP0401]